MEKALLCSALTEKLVKQSTNSRTTHKQVTTSIASQGDFSWEDAVIWPKTERRTLHHARKPVHVGG